MFAVSAFTRVISLMKPAFVGWGFAGRIAMLLPSRVAGRTLGLRGPDLARGPEVARLCSSRLSVRYGRGPLIMTYHCSR